MDALTGGALTAATSGERVSLIREWLAQNPSAEQMSEVFKDLANRDKGAAKLVKEKLDDIKRAKGQEAVAAEWADKAKALLALPKLNLPWPGSVMLPKPGRHCRVSRWRG